MIQEQKENFEFCNLYRYFEDPDWIGSLNVPTFETQFQAFELVDGRLFYYKTVNSLGEIKISIPSSLRKAILKGASSLTGNSQAVNHQE